MKIQICLKTLGWIAASTALSCESSSAAILLADDFSEADGTVLAGKSTDTGGVWTQPVGATLTIQGNAIETRGAARVGFVSFTRTTTISEITTVTLNNLATTGNFFSGGNAKYSLLSGGVNGTVELFFGDLNTSTFWGFQDGAAANSYASTNDTIVNTATFTYNPVTGIASLSLSDPGTGNPVISGNVGANRVFDGLTFSNNGGGDLKFGGVTVETTAVPEPSGALLAVTGLMGLLLRRRRD